jgi:hypothetical protein
MMIYHEKIAPPANPSPDEEQMKFISEALVSDDRWVKNLIDGVAGILRELAASAERKPPHLV